MPNFVVLGCLEVGEKFTVGWGVGVGGGISTPTTKSNQLKLGQVDVELGCDNINGVSFFLFSAMVSFLTEGVIVGFCENLVPLGYPFSKK